MLNKPRFQRTHFYTIIFSTRLRFRARVNKGSIVISYYVNTQPARGQGVLGSGVLWSLRCSCFYNISEAEGPEFSGLEVLAFGKVISIGRGGGPQALNCKPYTQNPKLLSLNTEP